MKKVMFLLLAISAFSFLAFKSEKQPPQHSVVQMYGDERTPTANDVVAAEYVFTSKDQLVSPDAFYDENLKNAIIDESSTSAWPWPKTGWIYDFLMNQALCYHIHWYKQGNKIVYWISYDC